MPVLFVTNDGGDVGAYANTTTSTFFDSNYVNRAINIPASGNSGSRVVPVSWSNGSATDGDIWIHFDWYQADVALNGFLDGHEWTITDASGNVIAYRDLNNDAAQWRINATGAGTGGTAIGSLTAKPAAQLRTFDIHINRTAGGLYTFTQYESGVQVVTGSFTQATWGMPSQIDLGGIDFQDTSPTYLSQILVQDTSTLGRKVTELVPNAAGYINQWSGDYTALADSNALTAVTTTLVGQRISSNIENWFGGTTGLIEKVVVKATASQTGGGASSIQQFVRIGSTNYDGASIALDATPTARLTEYTTNPATSSAWSTTEIDALEIGLRSGA